MKKRKHGIVHAVMENAALLRIGNAMANAICARTRSRDSI